MCVCVCVCTCACECENDAACVFVLLVFGGVGAVLKNSVTDPSPPGGKEEGNRKRRKNLTPVAGSDLLGRKVSIHGTFARNSSFRIPFYVFIPWDCRVDSYIWVCTVCLHVYVCACVFVRDASCSFVFTFFRYGWSCFIKFRDRPHWEKKKEIGRKGRTWGNQEKSVLFETSLY